MEAKKRRTSDPANTSRCDCLLTLINSDKKCVQKLDESVNKLDSRNNGFCLLKINNCNANVSVPFPKAFCSVSRNVDKPESRVTYQYDIIFQHGFDVIQSFIKNPSVTPVGKAETIALVRLLQFFIYDFEDCGKALFYDDEESLTDTEWSMKLTHHLLSRLGVSQSYILDECRCQKGHKGKCPCCSDNIKGVYGDTSIGCLSGWHGYVDVFLGKDSVPVKAVYHEPVTPDDDDSSSQTDSEDDLLSFRNQILAESIVFSFLQKKTYPDLDNFLIPMIGITKQNVLIYFYDCENDMLLESSPLPLFKQAELSLSTVLALWLVVNYKCFCTGTPPEMLEDGYTADFLKKEQQAFKVYREDVKYYCGISTDQVDFFLPDSYNFMKYRRLDSFLKA